MINSFKRGAAAYANVAVETGVASADPHQLIVLLYDGALSAIARAIRAIGEGQIAVKGESISKAIQIVEEGLKASLDESVGGELAQQLGSLYEYMARQLLFASVRNDVAALKEVARLLEDLKGAWESIGVQARPAGAAGRIAA
ncbi:flagellar export chaperone FliS [Betaproteobacteria bacterium GR16-43]|nr:flagellar export chaperone FliS [Betaproteobacteria bacterium GR16-43]